MGTFLGTRLRHCFGLPACLTAWLLLAAPLPALAGETIVWNGQGAPGTTGELRPDPWNPSLSESLLPSGPSGNTVTMNGGSVPANLFGGLPPAATSWATRSS